MSQTLAVDLSDTVVQHLLQVASSTQQSLEQIVRQSIEGNLPPKIPNASAKLRTELLRMQNISIIDLRAIADSEIVPIQQERHIELLEKNTNETIDEQERHELQNLRLQADELMLRKAYAWALLRWRGFPPSTTPLITPCYRLSLRTPALRFEKWSE